MTALPVWSPKDPEDIRTYWVDFSSLLASGESLTAASVTTTEIGTTLTVDDYDYTTKMVSALFSGGEIGKHPVQYHVTTSTGQEVRSWCYHSLIRKKWR